MRLIDADTLEVVCFKNKGGCFSDGVQWVLEKIDALPTIQPTPQWIPVSKDTPKTSANVIISHKDSVAIGWYDGKRWIKDGYLCETVKAWMPLPKMYKVMEE